MITIMLIDYIVTPCGKIAHVKCRVMDIYFSHHRS